MSLNFIINKIELCLICIYVTFIIAGSIVKNVGVDISNYLCLILLMIMLLDVGISKRYVFNNRYISVIIFIFWLLLTTLFSTNIENSVIGFFFLVSMSLLSILIINRKISPKEMSIIFNVFLITGIFSSVYLVNTGQNFYGNLIEERISISDESDPNYYAMHLLISFGIAYCRIFSNRYMYKKIFYICICVIHLYAIGLLASRGAVLSILILIFSHAIYNKKKVLIVCMLVLLFMIYSYVSDVLSRFSLDVIIASGGAGRTDIWLVGIEMIKDNFWLGVGLQNFPNMYNEYIHVSGVGVSKGLYRAPHSSVIRILSEIGSVGLVLYCKLIYTFVKPNLKKFLLIEDGLIWGGLSCIIASLFLDLLSDKVFWMTITLVAAYDYKDNLVDNKIKLIDNNL